MGCDGAACSSLRDILHFNPRTHMGCDMTLPMTRSLAKSFQSTHPHGVRLFDPSICRQPKTHFNPRTHMGCDPTERSNTGSAHIFQSTHPHGVRRSWSGPQIRYMHFNPRTHMGCDAGYIFVTHGSSTFQSTHPHGVRPVYLPQLKTAPDLFQSTHPHGVRLCYTCVKGVQRDFNPRTHMGCDYR